MNYLLINLRNHPLAMCSDISQATHDFNGKKLHDLGNLGCDSHWLTFSLIATDDSGAAVFSWLADQSNSEAVIASLHALSDADLPHAIIRWTLEFCENTYFAPDWWDELDHSVQYSLKARQLRGITNYEDWPEYPRPDGCLSDDGIRAVDWSVVSRVTSLPIAA